MRNGDFTDDTSVAQLLKRCEVIFSNNYLFDPRTQSARQPKTLSPKDKFSCVDFCVTMLIPTPQSSPPLVFQAHVGATPTNGEGQAEAILAATW